MTDCARGFNFSQEIDVRGRSLEIDLYNILTEFIICRGMSGSRSRRGANDLL